MSTRVREVTSRKELSQFIKYPLRLYAGDENFVPHLLSERRQFFSKRNPIFEFTDVHYLLAYNERGEVAGRMTAHVNRRHNEFCGERTGFFGFFECEERFEVASALFEAAERWLREHGMAAVQGPLNFSTNEECGFLADGFDSAPALMMPYTKKYYLEFVERLGYRKARDLWAYEYSYKGETPAYLVKFVGRIQKRTSVEVRMLDMSRFEQEIKEAFSVYNRAWVRNWGFVPMTEKQFGYTAKNLRSILDPALALVAEKDGETVGFCAGVPDYNPIFRKMRGRLFPSGIFHFILGRKRLNRVRILLMGVVREHRMSGVDALLVYQLFQNGVPRGYEWAELSWVLEDNVMLTRALDRLGASHYKTYRIFEKQL